MKLKLFSKCSCSPRDFDCGGYDYIVFRSKWFQFRWFYDNEHRFLYIHIGKKYWRFGG